MSRTSELKKMGYKTIKELGKEIGRELRPSDFPSELLKDGIKINGTLYPPSTILKLKEYIKIPASKKQEMTNLKKYGVKSTSQNKEIKEKQIKTLFNNYGVSSPAKSKLITKKISETAKKNNILTKGTLEERCFKFHDDNMVVCSDFLGENKNVYLYCNVCGNLFSRIASHIELSCPICSGKKTNTIIFINKARLIHNDNYDYSKTVYKNNKTKVKIFCKKCNVFFWQRPNDHLSGHGHDCIKSKQEEEINNYLLNNKINFTRQATFPECKGKKKLLPFDFYIPHLDLLIEVQGEQHIIKKDFFGDFSERQRLDKIKKDFAEKNHKFLEIFFYQNAIDTLQSYFNN